MDRLRPSKGIKLIKGCYPKKNENVDSQHLSHQLDALLKYLLYSPKTVPESMCLSMYEKKQRFLTFFVFVLVCKYIEKRMRKDLAKQRFGYGYTTHTFVYKYTRNIKDTSHCMLIFVLQLAMCLFLLKCSIVLLYNATTRPIICMVRMLFLYFKYVTAHSQCTRIS